MLKLVFLVNLIAFAVCVPLNGESDGNKTEEPLPGIKTADGCGFRNVEGVGFRIMDEDDDNIAKYGEFPWTVGVLKVVDSLSDTVVKKYQCDGSLIHPSVVLTAAHCVSGKEPSSLIVRAGEWDTQTKDELFPHQDRQVSEYIVHEQYDNTSNVGPFNDVALLFLVKAVEIAENVNPVCLPPQDMNFDLQRCFASGWAKDMFDNTRRYPLIMKRAEVSIVPKDVCLSELRETSLGQNFELHNSFICAGEPGKDTCKGNGGSPLVCPIPNTVHQYYQVGIATWRSGCGDTTPGTFSNVPLFRNWIEEKLQQKQIPTSSFTPVL